MAKYAYLAIWMFIAGANFWFAGAWVGDRPWYAAVNALLGAGAVFVAALSFKRAVARRP